MKLDIWYNLSLRVIALFFTAMIVSFSPELLRGFFGDTQIQPDSGGYIWGGGMIDCKWQWGFRHYLYFFMCIVLFVIQVVRLITWIEKNKAEFKP